MTPLFVQEATFGPDGGTGGRILGVSLTSEPTWSAAAIVDTTTEQTLVESIRYTAVAFSTDAGQLVLAMQHGNAAAVPIGSWEIPAGTASQWASGEIRLGILMPVGWKLRAMHNIQKSASYVEIVVSAYGGIVR